MVINGTTVTTGGTALSDVATAINTSSDGGDGAALAGKQQTKTDLTVQSGSRQLQQTQVRTLLQNYTARLAEVSQL